MIRYETRFNNYATFPFEVTTQVLWGRAYLNAAIYFLFCISQRGDSGQKNIPMTSGTAGIKALPN
jgi:hypothetical protein